MSKKKQMEIVDAVTGELSPAASSYFDEFGRELPNPKPIAPPIGYVRRPSLAEQIREMVRSERLAEAARLAGAETFEESEDFEVGDDLDPHSPWENEFDPPLQELAEAVEAERSRKSVETGKVPPEAAPPQTVDPQK